MIVWVLLPKDELRLAFPWRPTALRPDLECPFGVLNWVHPVLIKVGPAVGVDAVDLKQPVVVPVGGPVTIETTVSVESRFAAGDLDRFCAGPRL